MVSIKNTMISMNGHYQLEDIVLMKNPELTKQILEQTNFRCNSETIAVKYAMKSGDVENLRVLLHHGRGWKTRRAIFEHELFRLIDSNLESAKFIMEQLPYLDVMNEHFIISLRHLFEQGTHEAVRMLLQYNIDLYVKEKFAIKLLVNVFGNPKVNVIELLKNRDFDIHEQDVSGETALHSAVYNDVIENVRYLLEHGANPNSKDCVGWTPMFVVKSVECMELLLHYGGNLQCIDKDGYTIFDSLQNSLDAITQAALANLAIAEASGTMVLQVIRERINADENFRIFYLNCQQEIKCIKELKICGFIDLFTILFGDTEKVSHHFPYSEIISTILNQRRTRNGSVYSVLEKKLKSISNNCNVHHKPTKVAVKNDILNFYHLIVAKIINYLTIEDLLVIIFIVFNSIRIFF